MGYDSKAELDRDRANSPRAVLREFIQGTNSWNDGGRDRALSVLDLSAVPERLHDLEGPIYADFIRRIIDRVAYVIWQEVPDDPDRTVPYVYFQHPVGTITITKVTAPEADGAASVDRWKVSGETLATAPALLQAMQDLPVIGGLENPTPLSPFFRLREAMRTIDPELLEEWGYLELWQWLGMLGSILASGVFVWLTTRVMGALSRLTSKTAWLAQLAFPTGSLGAGVIVNWMVWRLGVTQTGIPLIGSLTSVLLVLTIAFFGYRLATVAGGWAHATAKKTTSYVDEIATSLGTGLVKLLIVVGAIIAIADVAGLPYEGVLTGLGVGGVAIAFAARDTVSNIMGGGLLMADRPFYRGDLIEIDGKLATVEEVGLRSTRLRALDDTLLHVPNVQLSDRIIANWGRRRRRKLSMLIGVTYDTPREKLDEFAKRLREVLLSQPTVDPADVYVGLQGFGASSIDIDLLCHLQVSDYASQVQAQHKIMMDIIALAEELGVEFAFPTRTLHLADPMQVFADRLGNEVERADPSAETSPTPAKTQG
jgi:small-conductance mechanosensitive channel